MGWDKPQYRHLKQRYDKQYRIQLRANAIDAYGGKCSCCQESINEFLQIDHIHGGGRRHSTNLGGSKGLYKWIRGNKYPSGFQVLCANCNLGRFRNDGQCPHLGATTKAADYHRIYRRKLQSQVFSILGDNCKCCGISDNLFLTIDHINGGGKAERTMFKDNDKIYTRIRDDIDGCRNSFQLLCMNCNAGKSICGQCPHKDVTND